MGIVEIGFVFCLRFRRHFFRHTDFSRFKISKKFVFKIQIFCVIEKCIGWVLVYPFFWGGVFIKNAKKMCICDYVILVLTLIKNVF